MNASMSDSSAGRAGMAAKVPPPQLTAEEITVGRYASAALWLIAGILAVYSVFAVWWYSSGTGVTTQFYPGTMYKLNGTWSSYTASGLGPFEGLYLAILVLGIVGGALLIVAGVLRARNVAMNRPPSSRRNVWMAIAGTALNAGAWIAGVAMVPWLFGQSSSQWCSNWSGTSACSIPWGSGTHNGVSLTWFTADGWVIMLGALTLAIIGLVTGRLSRNPSES